MQLLQFEYLFAFQKSNMSGKVAIFCVVLGVLACQVASSSSSEEVQTEAIQDFIDTVKEAIAKLTKAVNDAIAKAQQKLQDILTKVEAMATAVIAKAKVAIANQVAKVEKQIAELEAQASALGIDVSECVDDNEELLKQLAADTVRRLVDCVTGEVNQAVKIVTDTVSDLIEIKDEVIALPAELKNCTTSAKPASCMVALLSEVIKDGTQLPISISRRVAEATKLISNIEADLTQCAMSKVMDIAKQAGDVGATVAKCIAAKIDAATTPLPPVPSNRVF